MVYPNKTTSYSYDANYNRLTERSLDSASQALLDDKSYRYNSRNQLEAITDHSDSAQSVSYSFDANGNQTIKTKNGVVTTFLYDTRDQLISVQENATTLGLFYYDYQGMRVAKDMGGQIVRYTYDGKAVLTQSDVNGQTLAKYEYGPDQLLSLQHVTEGRQYYLFDALGSVSNLTNTSGLVQARYQYDAFGNLRAEAGSSFNRFTFTGHEKDTETGLYYFKARFYDPDTGRFLNQDAYLGDVNTPPSLHRYLYAYSNPVVYVDLYGYYSWDQFKDDVSNGAHRVANETREFVEDQIKTGQRLAGAACGISVSAVEGVVGTVQLANDAIETRNYLLSGGLLGSRDSAVRMKEMGEGLAHAASHPVDTANAIGKYYGQEFDNAAREGAEGNYFTEGMVNAKHLTDIYGAVRTLPELARLAKLAPAAGKTTAAPSGTLVESPNFEAAPRQPSAASSFGQDSVGAARVKGTVVEQEVAGSVPNTVGKTAADNVYFRSSVEFDTSGLSSSTGFKYKVFQRSDIDWQMVREGGAKPGRGLTNAEAAEKYGLAPILPDKSVATLHHSQQSAVGPLFEASTRYHNISNAQRAPLHPYGSAQHPDFPLGRGPGSLRDAFQRVDSLQYWKWRGAQELGK